MEPVTLKWDQTVISRTKHSSALAEKLSQTVNYSFVLGHFGDIGLWDSMGEKDQRHRLCFHDSG